MINPAAIEVCDGILDEDCDGLIDDADDSIDATTQVTWYADTDADTYGDVNTPVLACLSPTGFVADATDCDDAQATVNPAGAEICNGLDDDCDTLFDDQDPSVDNTTQFTCYLDADGDAWGDPNNSLTGCSLPTGYTIDGTDCNDSNAAINPGTAEICDANDTDENCNGLADDADSSTDAASQTTWYADPDGNSFGEPANFLMGCEQPDGYVSTLAGASDVWCGSGVWGDDVDIATIDGTDFAFSSTDAFTVSITADLDVTTSGYLVVKGDNSTSEWSITTVPAGVTDVATMCFNRQGLVQLVCLEVSTAGFHNYTWVYNAGTIEFYEDGVFSASETGNIGTASTLALSVGNYPGLNYSTYESMDDMAIWQGALSASDIASYVDGSLYATDLTGNLGWWRFDEGSGLSTGDLSGLSHAMNLSGVDWATTCQQ